MKNFSFNKSKPQGQTKNGQRKQKYLDQSAAIIGKQEQFMARSGEARALSPQDITLMLILELLKNNKKLPQATSNPTTKSLVNDNFEQSLSEEDIKASVDIVPPSEYQKYDYTLPPPPIKPAALAVLTAVTANNLLISDKGSTGRISDNSTTTSTGSTGLSYKSDINLANNPQVNSGVNNYTIPTHDIPTQKDSAVIKNNHLPKTKKSSADLQHNKSNNHTQNTESSIAENKNSSTNSSTRESVEEKAISPAPNVGKVVHENPPENNDIDQFAVTSNSASNFEEKEDSSSKVTPELPTEDSSSIEQEINTYEEYRVKRYVNGGGIECGEKNGLALMCYNMFPHQRELVKQVFDIAADVYQQRYLQVAQGRAKWDVILAPNHPYPGQAGAAGCGGDGYCNKGTIYLRHVDEKPFNIETIGHEVIHAFDYANGHAWDNQLQQRAVQVEGEIQRLWERKYSAGGTGAGYYSQTPNANLYGSPDANNKVIIYSLNPTSNRFEAHECPKNIINAAIPVPIFDIKNNKSCSTVPTSRMKSADTDIIIIKNDNSWIKYDSKTETLNSGSDSGTGSITLYECPPPPNPRCKWAQNSIKSFACSVTKESSTAHVKQTVKYLLDDIIEAYCRPSKNINYDPTKPSGQLHTPPIVAEYPTPTQMGYYDPTTPINLNPPQQKNLPTVPLSGYNAALCVKDAVKSVYHQFRMVLSKEHFLYEAKLIIIKNDLGGGPKDTEFLLCPQQTLNDFNNKYTDNFTDKLPSIPADQFPKVAAGCTQFWGLNNILKLEPLPMPLPIIQAIADEVRDAANNSKSSNLAYILAGVGAGAGLPHIRNYISNIE